MKASKDYLKFILAMVLFGTNGLIVSNISLQSSEIVLMRTLLGAAMLGIIVLATRSFSLADLKADILPASIGGIALGLNWMLLFAAYRSAGVGLSTLTYYCAPILVLALSPVIFKEKLSLNKLLAVAAVALGMVLLTGRIEPGSEVAKGVLLGAGAAALYAVIIVSGKKVTKLSGMNCALYELMLSFCVVLICLIISGTELPIIPKKSELIYVLIIGLSNTGLAYYLYFSSLQRLPAQSVALICYIDPLTALFISAVFLHEALAPLQIVGAVLVLGGAMFGELKKKNKDIGG